MTTSTETATLDARIACGSCQAGQGPNPQVTGCEQCTTLATCTGATDTDGNACELSDDGGTSCQPGRGTDCIYAAAVPAFSSLGVCQPCVAPNVVSNDRTRCYACDPGDGPSEHRTSCGACAGIAESCGGDLDAEGGGCELVADRSSCSLDTGSSCAYTSSTLDFSASGECLLCAFPGVVDESGQICEGCEPGKEPNAERNGCSPCIGATYSSFGVQCVECPLVE